MSKQYPLLILLVLLFVAGCGSSGDSQGTFGRAAPGVCMSFAPGSLRIALADNELRFYALGDTGRGNDGQHKVAQALSRSFEVAPSDFVLFLGDNFYASGVQGIDDPQWVTKYLEVYDEARLPVPFYPVLGNHDHLGDIAAEIMFSSNDSRWTMPSCYYSVTYELNDGNVVQLFAIDTEVLADLGSLESYQQHTWLERELSDSTAVWKVVYGHHPLISSGGHSGDANVQRLHYLLSPLFERNGVDLYLSGHDHHLEVIKENDRALRVISGAGSETKGYNQIPESIFASASLGFVEMTVDASGLSVTVISDQNELLFETHVLDG